MTKRLFYQYICKLEEPGAVDHRTVFIDGMKIESRAGRYTFYWRKTVEKQLAKVRESAKSAGFGTLKSLQIYLEQEKTNICFAH